MSRQEANRITRDVERTRRSRRYQMKYVLPTVAALGAGTAVAIGSIPSSSGVITGCYVTTTSPPGTPTDPRYGQLRVIDPDVSDQLVPAVQRSCLSDEAMVTWNQQGPQGPVGPQGVQGTIGAPGPAGTPLIGQTSFGLSSSGKLFLKLDGIDGESIDAKHKKQIEVGSFSMAAGPSQGSPFGSGAGKSTIQSFTITKQIDKASPLLFKTAGLGQHIKLGTVAFAKGTGGKEVDYLTFTFTDLLVSGITDGVAHNKPVEQVTFSFQKAKETFQATGKSKSVSINYNVGSQKVR